MKKLSIILFLSVAVCAAAQIAPQDYPSVTTQEIADARRFTVSLAVMGPDWPLYSAWGHCAMIVEEIPSPENAADLLDLEKPFQTMYDYGIFDMRQKGFFKDFAFGIMNYAVMASDPTYSLRFPYQAQHRSVDILTLNLPPEGKMRAVKYLRENVKPENSLYRYNFFTNNCSTILRDIIDMALDGQLYEIASAETEYTLREHLFRYLDNRFWTEWGFDYVLGPPMDHTATVWETLFMPPEMLKVLPAVSYTDGEGRAVPLVSGRKTVAEAGDDMPIIRQTPAATWIPALLMGIVFGAIGGFFALIAAIHPGLRIFGGIFTAAVAAFLFACSLILTHFMAFTEFDCTYGNWNLLAAGPLLLLLIFASIRYAAGRRGARAFCTVGWFLCLTGAVILLILEETGVVQQSSRMILMTVIPMYGLFFAGNLFAVSPKPENRRLL